MALAILDGTQTATTLSTILSSGQHITAHTVVSLGTQAITDMRSAVSGSVVSISNLPATQPISGTVTAMAGTNFSDEISEGILNYTGNYEFFPILGTVTIGNSVTIGSLPAISGTVTIGAGTAQIGSVTASISGTVPISISSVTVGNSVTIGSLPSISGTVTANLGNVAGTNLSGTIPSSAVRIGWGGEDTFRGAGTDANGEPLPIQIYLGNSGGDNVTTANPLPISGTVTANSSNGSLTTRFGSVTTANTAFATSAVTNSNRKYLLIQNVTTASNVITVGIGFTPTTTQGIQLSSGAGLTFEGSYIPTGAVNLLSSVTASCFTILEA